MKFDHFDGVRYKYMLTVSHCHCHVLSQLQIAPITPSINSCLGLPYI